VKLEFLLSTTVRDPCLSPMSEFRVGIPVNVYDVGYGINLLVNST